MAYQVVANSDKFILGSADLQIGTSIGALASVGSLQGIKFTSDGAASDIEFDNASAITKKSLKGCLVEANSSEIDVAMLKTIFGSTDDVYATVAGVLVPAYSDVFTQGSWAFDTFVPFAKQNGSGLVQTIASVTASVDGLLVVDVDYMVTKNPSTGAWGLVFTSTGAISTGLAQNITSVYAYTPSAAKTLTVMAGNFIPTAFVARLTHTNDAGKIFQITINKCYSTEFMQFPFSPDGGNEVMRMPLKIKGVADANSVAYEIYDNRVY